MYFLLPVKFKFPHNTCPINMKSEMDVNVKNLIHLSITFHIHSLVYFQISTSCPVTNNNVFFSEFGISYIVKNMTQDSPHSNIVYNSLSLSLSLSLTHTHRYLITPQHNHQGESWGGVTSRPSFMSTGGGGWGRGSEAGLKKSESLSFYYRLVTVLYLQQREYKRDNCFWVGEWEERGSGRGREWWREE